MISIGQAATFDLELVEELTRVTVNESRAASNFQYSLSQGQNSWYEACCFIYIYSK